ncbi:hypothetical protein BN946_scf184517.g2 [Trametes cinnabarina]|uniref:Uncharacterized protein n=1 Tax=Pycnoporus cinnabarinus TaxID=5643 RepID=A0A060ST10_PYCCI|nr:hypothetical protein BN946_scf184517.g2 [Trametes cinnabarina]
MLDPRNVLPRELRERRQALVADGILPEPAAFKDLLAEIRATPGCAWYTPHIHHNWLSGIRKKLQRKQDEQTCKETTKGPHKGSAQSDTSAQASVDVTPGLCRLLEVDDIVIAIHSAHNPTVLQMKQWVASAGPEVNIADVITLRDSYHSTLAASEEDSAAQFVGFPDINLYNEDLCNEEGLHMDEWLSY